MDNPTTQPHPDSPESVKELTPSQYAVLKAVAAGNLHYSEQPGPELDKTYLNGRNVSRGVKTLCTRGLIRTGDYSHPRRYWAITPAGRAVLEQGDQ
jgi:hypothetical protein